MERSVEVILAGQSPSGAYVACPNFAPYRYSWFRDGAFIADSMSRVGEVDSAARFFDWCASVVRARPEGPWDSRYRLDGSPDDDPNWPHYQLDGLGLWVWAVSEHALRHGGDAGRWADATELTLRFLREHVRDPCIDWWEEREGVHPVTVGCILAAFAAAGDDAEGEVGAAFDEAMQNVRVDASLLALVAPLEVCDPQPLTDTVAGALRSPGGGVHRNLDDEFYGGGEWLLLTAMLGLARARGGDDEGARASREWIEAHAAPNGELPEQSQDHLLRPHLYEPWVQRWGPPPQPLLWSHAMYLTLTSVLAR